MLVLEPTDGVRTATSPTVLASAPARASLGPTVQPAAPAEPAGVAEAGPSSVAVTKAPRPTVAPSQPLASGATVAPRAPRHARIYLKETFEAGSHLFERSFEAVHFALEASSGLEPATLGAVGAADIILAPEVVAFVIGGSVAGLLVASWGSRAAALALDALGLDQAYLDIPY